MRGSHKSKRVSWATDENLRQVRLFLSEDSPSQVGLGVQDHLQAKKSWLLHSAGGGTDDQLPPGFEDSAHSESQLKKELSQISLVKWQCPPRFFLDPHWQVVAGQESKEGGIQNQREMRVLEAYYPRRDDIPDSPSVPLECDNIPYDDRQTPLIPVTPIEDEDTSDPSFSSTAATVNNPQMSQLPVLSQTPPQHMSTSVNTATVGKPHRVGFVPGVQPDAVGAAASAAFSAIMKTNEQASMIDPELLIQILNNPQLIEKLVSDYGPSPANGNLQNNTTTRARSPPLNLSAPQSSSLPFHINRLAPEASSMSTMHTSGHYYPVNNAMSSMLHARPLPPPHGSGNVQFSTTPPIVNVPPPPPPLRDMYYYKSLIQQHGGERSESENHSPPQAHQFIGNNQQQQHFGAAVANQEHHLSSLHNSKQRETGKPKINKPCMYFNSSRGCKNGANCGFQHDPSFKPRMPESQHGAKRMKLDREITGRT
ncbi:hypothetical protein C5167_010297 [Papaver somniferum]|uniref:C3H1-type domain-containing protein n=1 Tax=Papaver somniferum TaxID=3469 RepID=A0A4Y7JZU9_PAPSO|nr:zinc finger CCCH domain-containing protein 6-like [Papaver somniferum]RZC66603.1 hypothetical protein C5167_010297 [Papaver somniferum]